MTRILLLTLILIIPLILAFPATATDVSKEWECGSGMTCISDSCGTYKKIANNEYSFTLNADPGIYECEVTTKNCCYGFIGTEPEKNEYIEIYLNNDLLGNTNDLFCNEAAEEEPGCWTYGASQCNLQGGRCTWYTFQWYDKPRGVCLETDGYIKITPPEKPGHGCDKNNEGTIDNFLLRSYEQKEIDFCTIYYHSRWPGDADRTNYNHIKSPKYCTDATYYKKDCGFDEEGSVVKPAQGSPNGPKCQFDHDHRVLEDTYVRGGAGILCSEIYDGPMVTTTDHEWVRLISFLHYKNPKEDNYVCCFGYQLADGLHCVNDKECASGVCKNNRCEGGIVGGCDGDGECDLGESYELCGPDDCECDEDYDCLGVNIICRDNICISYASETEMETDNIRFSSGSVYMDLIFSGFLFFI
ncbi:hypothetical protein ACFLQO_01380 [Candidatus Aenigmatarchaeota archaeon]